MTFHQIVEIIGAIVLAVLIVVQTLALIQSWRGR